MSADRLNDEVVAEIRRLDAEGVSRSAISRHLGVTRGSVLKYLGLLPERPSPVALAAAPTPGRPASPIVAELFDEGRFAACVAMLRKKPMDLDAIATAAGTSRGSALDWVETAKARGLNIHKFGDTYSIEKAPVPANVSREPIEYFSRPDHTFVFGALGDSHLASKYARLDVLNALYDRYAQEGVDRVFHSGNWIDGEARFNKHDLLAHGMQGQIDYLVEHYPRRDGIVTYAISGDDHEGWYCGNTGVDIGRHAFNSMRDAGRDDWVDLGYMESTVRLVNSETGVSSTLTVQHPGGGSSYALSYTSQKIVESFEGGEKPAVLVTGHYHKLWAGNIRNVWVFQSGCTQDQTPFMRKKRLEAHVGGGLLKLKQDPRTGAIVEFLPNMLRYFNRGYYENNRWSHSGKVTQPPRGR